MNVLHEELAQTSDVGGSGSIRTPASLGPLPLKPKARLVVVGGGFAGATLARFVKRLSPEISVVLIEARDHYVSCPMSNLVIAGQRSLAAQTFDYQGLEAAGVDVVRDMATMWMRRNNASRCKVARAWTMTAWCLRRA